MRTQNAKQKLSHYKALALTALKESAPSNIDSYAYFGDLDRERLWVGTIGRNRDSDLIAESNFERIYEDALKMFGDDYVTIERSSHWACGWVEQIFIKMFHDDGAVTSAGLWMIKTNESLQNDYPLYDDSDYSDRTSEHCSQTLDENLESWVDDAAEALNIEEPNEEQKAALEQIVSTVFDFDRGWSGDDQAWFDINLIKHMNKYDLGELENNLFFESIKKLNKQQ